MPDTEISDSEKSAITLAADLFEAGKIYEAFKKYQELAEQGFVKSQEFLGWMYYEGCGIEKNDELAVRWLKTAFANGSISAAYRLGILYESRKDYPSALDYYQRCAVADYAPGFVRLGGMYDAGKGLPQDFRQAKAMYARASERGNVNGLRRLGRSQWRGRATVTFFERLAGLIRIFWAYLLAIKVGIRNPDDERLLG